MNIFFLILYNITEVDTHGIYVDLMRKFRNDEDWFFDDVNERSEKKTRFCELLSK